MPALACDRRGYRLGYGGGYYDRWLAGCSGWKVGLCRAALLQDRLPRGPYDIPVDLVVTETEPGVKGDTATNVTKAATLETGAQIKVPLFINEGEKIQIDTRTGEYLGRCKE